MLSHRRGSRRSALSAAPRVWLRLRATIYASATATICDSINPAVRANRAPSNGAQRSLGRHDDARRALAQNNDAIGEDQRFVDVVRYEQRGETAALPEVGEFALQDSAGQG